jgi:hypothetical protein
VHRKENNMPWTRKILCAALAFMTSSVVVSAVSGTAQVANLPLHPGLTTLAVVASTSSPVDDAAAA